MPVQFVTGQRYLLVTVDDSLYEGTIVSSENGVLTMELTEDSDFFVTGDIVTIFIDKIIAFRQVTSA